RKLGLNKSYIMVNTFLYGLKGQMDAEAQTISASAAIKNWRNQLLDMLKTGQTQAVIAFGAGTHKVVDLWPGAAGLFVAKPLPPSSRDDAGLRGDWNNWIPQIRPHVTPDVPPDMATYVGSTFKKADLENIPPRDLPFGVPKWMGTGDTAWRTSPTQIAWKSLAAEGERHQIDRRGRPPFDDTGGEALTDALYELRWRVEATAVPRKSELIELIDNASAEVARAGRTACGSPRCLAPSAPQPRPSAPPTRRLIT